MRDLEPHVTSVFKLGNTVENVSGKEVGVQSSEGKVSRVVDSSRGDINCRLESAARGDVEATLVVEVTTKCELGIVVDFEVYAFVNCKRT